MDPYSVRSGRPYKLIKRMIFNFATLIMLLNLTSAFNMVNCQRIKHNNDNFISVEANSSTIMENNHVQNVDKIVDAEFINISNRLNESIYTEKGE